MRFLMIRRIAVVLCWLSFQAPLSPDIETKPAQALRLSTSQDSGTELAYAQPKGGCPREEPWPAKILHL